MDVQELEAFWWIAQTGTFNRAAERLYLTQPSVTARIQVLERELGQQLFERKPRGVRLTDAGRALLPHAERVLQDISKARQAVADLLSATGGTLTVGCAETTSTYVLPDILALYKQRHPGVEMTVRTGSSQAILQLVADDAVHLGLLNSPINPQIDVDQVPLYDEEIILVAHPSHPLVQEEAITLNRLAREPFLTADRSCDYWVLVDKFWSSSGVVPRTAMDLNSVEAAKRMVLQGFGITMLPETCVRHEIRTGQMARLHIAGVEPLRRRTFLAHRRGKIWSGMTRAFLLILQQQFSVSLEPGDQAAAPPRCPADQTDRSRARTGVRQQRKVVSPTHARSEPLDVSPSGR